MEQYFHEAFGGLVRLGPGSEASTKKAISLVPLPKDQAIRILDIGCGTGIHTMLLAEAFPKADITAIDISEEHLEVLKEKLKIFQLEDRIQVKNQSMFDLDYPEGTFDLIWSEGTIYIAGFQSGLKDWRSLLKDGGYLFCSEISWLHAMPSESSRAFWEQGYAEMNTIPNKIIQVEANQYAFEASFVLPKSDWLVEYYAPLADRLKQMKEKYPENEEALNVVAMLEQEINLFKQHPDDYSYVFYGMRK
ncbi:bifunctional 2-polyprenyl-6-hydroxyphenol methylase/3-demethylubiquinol 3-O-methyltransferase UbiG [Jeotgalibacillus sp. R-1-5s-1]|uniref:class I SAM-dependent methyltransferase n=1 Tax=Jeotgalibacillus sp. R-1-5s-1 TaxID=2555897 RepID=UPI00106BEC0D|nr:class I SAM-dependent methyltransferase [Jeotgalibacillus sp. R-1-5s-1]TFD94499.1 class I SAM-dependent methyltransferase [Jeotgalibacillus sp. R-1-5s-1]